MTETLLSRVCEEADQVVARTVAVYAASRVLSCQLGSACWDSAVCDPGDFYVACSFVRQGERGHPGNG